MTHLADLTSQVVLRLREHFQIEGELPPPCPASLVGWLRLNIAINALRAALPPAVDFTSRDWQEITQHEVVERLRTITGDLSRQFATWNLKGRPGGIAAIPPVPQQAFIGLCWAADRLRGIEQAAPAPAAPATAADDEPNDLLDEICDSLRSPDHRCIVSKLWNRKRPTRWEDLAQECGTSTNDSAVKKALQRLDENLAPFADRGVCLDNNQGTKRVRIVHP